MNILILGGNSFVARSIKPYLENTGNYVYAPLHKEIDITNFLDLSKLFKNNTYDYVINCVISGARRTNNNEPKHLHTNLLGLSNLLYFQNKYQFKLLLFCSGAIYNKDTTIFNVKEGEFEHLPTDYYGLFKRTQYDLIKNKSNIILLRLFNLFGIEGMEDSFIYSSIIKALKNENIEIWNDCFFSVFYNKDLAYLINFIIENKKRENFLEFNVTYNDCIKLSEIANKIKNWTNSKSNIIINDRLGKAYCGNGSKLQKLNLPFIGRDKGILEVINYIEKRII